ncbi:MAG: hypothetical protein RIE59_02040 [Imperialibacter sp.]
MNSLSLNNKIVDSRLSERERDVLAAFKPTSEEMPEIRQGMTPQQIADVVSDRIMEVVKKQFEESKKQFAATTKK